MTAAPASIGDRLAERVTERQSQLVLGLDPDPNRLWPGALEQRGSRHAGAGPAIEAAAAIAIQSALAIDATADYCVAVKLQLACFERFGAPGWGALERVAAHARSRGLLVIADGKRGDIDVSAAAYGQSLFGGATTQFGHVEGLGADWATVNPLLGMDALRPLREAARERGSGLFVLVRTSNPGASDLQELKLADGGTLSERLATMVAELGSDGIGARGLSDVGAVVGATAPERLAALRELMPSAIFLLPGVGAQGGSVEELAPAFAPGPAGGLVSSSRGIVYAHERSGGDPADAAAREASRLRELAWRLAG
ncbi:MAG TPA: orotidine-5'-phosphate decarboxylase [Solirubrobacteraceae bacterium]|jgi:orotidine-5'-phosphate decarboxylase